MGIRIDLILRDKSHERGRYRIFFWFMKRVDFVMFLMAFGAVPAALAGASLTVSSSEAAPIRSVLGRPLEDGCVVRVGLVNLTDPSAVRVLRESTAAAEVETVFQSLGETGQGVVQPGAFQDRLRVNGFSGAGDFFGNIPDIPVPVSGGGGKSLCLWIFNAAKPADATQWGIFSARSGWEMPPDEGTEALSTSEITDVFRGSAAPVGFRLASVGDPGYAGWAASRGGDAPDPAADGDADSLANLIEYTLGTNPEDSQTTPPWPDADGVYHFTVDTSRADVEWCVQWSADLKTWLPADVRVLETREGIARCAATAPGPEPQCFFRIRSLLKNSP